MVFRFSSNESVPRAVRRIAFEQSEAALQALNDSSQNLDHRVHETRKHIKRLRALLALVASKLEPALLEHFTQALRQTAHTLAELRGRAALAESFDALNERYAGALDASQTERIRGALRSSVVGTHDVEATLEAARRSLRLTCQLSAELWTGKGGWSVLEPGYRRTYRRARRALAKARAEPTAERLHALRTPTKRHLYQLQLLEAVAHEVVGERRKALDALGDSLGAHHDLSLLLAELEERRLLGGPGPTGTSARSFESAAHERGQHLQEIVLRSAEELFGEPPRRSSERFARRFGSGRRLR